MLTKSQEKLIKSLHTKKARKKNGLCLVEGKKVIDLAKEYIEYEFGSKDLSNFKKFVTTETPQAQAAIARIPKWEKADILSRDIIVVLDGVQDPGNAGSILRLCLGFKASLVLADSVDVASPKVIRSSVGAMFGVPWMYIKKEDINSFIKSLSRPVYRLEKKRGAIEINKVNIDLPIVLIVGSEGRGIQTKARGKSIYIRHYKNLESLNVGHALAIALYWLRK